MAGEQLRELAASGYGTMLARQGFLLVWAMQLVNGVITGFLRPGNPIAIVAYATALPAVLLTTSPGRRRPSRPRAWTAVAAILLFGTLSLFFDDGNAPVGLPYFAGFLLGLLVTRGHLIIGAAGLAGYLAVLLYWGGQSDAPQGELVARMVIAACMTGLGYLWRFLIDRVTARELAHQTELADAALAATIAADSARRTAEDLRSVRDEAVPVLELLRDGGQLPPGAHQLLAITEASIRDRIRVPRLQTPPLYRAVRQARERGVGVHLIGEASDPRPPLSEALGNAVAKALAELHEGEATIRIPPERPSAGWPATALTLLAHTGRSTMRWEFDAEGRAIRHG